MNRPDLTEFAGFVRIPVWTLACGRSIVNASHVDSVSVACGICE